MVKIALVGEAFGEQEERLQMPFVGGAGKVLNGMLKQAGINREDCFVTNVFNFRPKPDNKIENLCIPKKLVPADYPWVMLSTGNYVHPKYVPEIVRLKAELEEVKPNIVVALGNTACWALLQQTGIKKLRGYTTTSSLVPGLKVIPSWHPAAVMREWPLRPATVLDLIKARRESEFPEIRRPTRWLTLEPTLDDMERFFNQYLTVALNISIDIETHVPAGFIACIGFAALPSRCITIPFYDETKANGCYWPTPQMERKAWEWVLKVCRLPNAKLGQNFALFDLVHLWRRGVIVKNFTDDTMILHHSLQPEEKKDLGWLGATYADDGRWKDMKRWGRGKSPKRDE